MHKQLISYALVLFSLSACKKEKDISQAKSTSSETIGKFTFGYLELFDINDSGDTLISNDFIVTGFFFEDTVFTDPNNPSNAFPIESYPDRGNVFVNNILLQERNELVLDYPGPNLLVISDRLYYSDTSFQPGMGIMNGCTWDFQDMTGMPVFSVTQAPQTNFTVDLPYEISKSAGVTLNIASYIADSISITISINGIVTTKKIPGTQTAVTFTPTDLDILPIAESPTEGARLSVIQIRKDSFTYDGKKVLFEYQKGKTRSIAILQ